MMRMCGLESTLTSLLVCRSCKNTPNEGMFTFRTPNSLVCAGSMAGPNSAALRHPLLLEQVLDQGGPKVWLA